MRVYSTDPFALVFQTPHTENGASGDISILEMLFSTSLVAMILSPRLLRIINTKVIAKSTAPNPHPESDTKQRQSTICELTFPGRVGALKLNRKRLMVVLDDLIFVYDITTMKVLHQILTPSNPYGTLIHTPMNSGSHADPS